MSYSDRQQRNVRERPPYDSEYDRSFSRRGDDYRDDYTPPREFRRGGSGRGRGGSKRGQNKVQFGRGAKIPKDVDFSDVAPKHVSKTPTPPQDEPLWEDSVFSCQMSVTETRGETFFHGDYSTLVGYSDDVYDVMTSGQQDVEKKMSKEMFRYYVTVLLWARIIDLKSQQGLVLTEVERHFKDTLQTLELTVPHPIHQYLMGIGTVKRMGGNVLYPEFPALPDGVIAGNGGYFTNVPMVAADLPDYIAFPVLGVMADALRAQTTQPFAGAYASPVAPQGSTATINLPGFSIASKPRPEALSNLVAAGITPFVFPERIPGTGLNLDVVTRVSNSLVTMTVYKTVNVRFIGLPSKGSVSQVIVQEKVDPHPGRFADGIFRGLASEGYSTTEYGVASAFAYMLPRADAAGAPVPIDAWSPINFGGGAIPVLWTVATANGRFQRNPPEVTMNIWHGIELDTVTQRSRSDGQTFKNKNWIP